MTSPYDSVPSGDFGPLVDRHVERPRRRGSAIRAAFVVAGVVVAAGPLLGWIWYLVAPRLAVVRVEGGFVYADGEPEQAVAADGWFAILTLAAGLLAGVLAWVVLRRRRGVAVLVGASLGSLVAAALASYVGHRLGTADFEHVKATAAMGERVAAPLGLRITGLDPANLSRPWPTGVVAVQALATAFAYTCCAGFSPYADLRRPEAWAVPDDGADSGADDGADQFGPGRPGSSASATGTART